MKKHYILLLIIFTWNNAVKAQWRQINGPFDGRINVIVINGNNIFAGTYGGGVFLSGDNGENWEAVNTGLPANSNILSLSISGTTIFAGTNSGVFSSADNGSNWTEVNTGLPASTTVYSLAVENNNIFAGTSKGMYLSVNNGSNWTEVNTGLPANSFVKCITIKNATIFAGTNNGVFSSVDNGGNWVEANNGLPVYTVFSLISSGNNLYAGTYDGVYFSEDNGNNWTGLNIYDPIGFVYSLAVQGTNIFAGAWANGIYGNGIIASGDNGNTWAPANSGLTDNEVYALAISGNTLFAGTNTGMFLSSDNGNTWTAAGTRLPASSVRSLNVNNGTMLAGTHEGIYMSENNGNTWTATGYYFHDSPSHSVNVVACKGNVLFAGTSGAGLFRSTDRGNTWTVTSASISDVHAIAVSGNTILAGGMGGVHLSSNNGNTWKKVNTGLTGGQVIYAMVVSGNNIFAGTDNGVYLFSNGNLWTPVNTGLPANTSIFQLTIRNNILFASTTTEVFLSSNNGSTWTAINAGLPATNSLIFGGNSVFAGTNDGVFLSTNNGTAWTAANTGLPSNTYVNSLATSYHTIFATVKGSGVWENPSLFCVPPVVTAHASSDTVCAGTTVTLTGAGTASYEWSGGVINGVAFIPSETATYTVTGTDANSCSNTAFITIHVNPLPAAVISPSSPVTLCESDSVRLAATDSAGFAYLWSTGATSQSISAKDSGDYFVTITNSYGCSAVSPATTVKTVACDYAITSVQRACISSGSFCMPVTKELTDVHADSIIGYDIALHYNKNKVHPTGTISLSNDLVNSNYVSTAVYVNDSVVNISLYLNSTAPPNTFFKGTGKLLCVNFTKENGFASVDSAWFSGNIDASYASATQSHALGKGVFSTYQDSLFYGKLVNWTDNAAIGYTPEVNLITRIYGTETDCSPKTTAPVATPDAEGNFTYSILQAKSLKIERDIDNTTKAGMIHGGFISGNDAQFGSYVVTQNPVFQPTIYQMLALDVNADGKISSGDLSQIAQRALSVLPEFTQPGQTVSRDWVFVNDSLLASSSRYTRSSTYPNDDGMGFSRSHVPVVPSCLKIPLTNGDCPLILPGTFTGILLGDIDSSYQYMESRPALTKTTENTQATVRIDLSNAVWNGSSADIPVTITSTEQPVRALDFKIQIDRSNLTYHSVIKQAGYLEMLSNYYEDENAVGLTSYGGNQSYETGKPLMSIRFSSLLGSIGAADFTSAIAFINGKPAKVEVVNGVTGTISADNNAGTIDIYPNPFSSQATIRFSEEQKNTMLKITDMLGNEIKTINFTGKQLVLDKGEMEAGIYFVEVSNGNKNVTNRKVVIK